MVKITLQQGSILPENQELTYKKFTKEIIND